MLFYFALFASNSTVRHTYATQPMILVIFTLMPTMSSQASILLMPNVKIRLISIKVFEKMLVAMFEQLTLIGLRFFYAIIIAKEHQTTRAESLRNLRNKCVHFFHSGIQRIPALLSNTCALMLRVRYLRKLWNKW